MVVGCFFSHNSSTWLWCSQNFPHVPHLQTKYHASNPGSAAWNTLPPSSESAYSEITVSTTQPATQEILAVFSSSGVQPKCCFSSSVCLTLCTSLFFSVSLCIKTCYFRRWPFQHRFFLAGTMPHGKKQQPRREQKGSSLSRGQRIWTFLILFLL